MWKRVRKTWPGYLFISPAGLLITVFSYIAIIFSLYISFYQYDIISEARPFEGLENYTRALSDKLVRISFRNTFIYVIVIVPSITIISLMLAVLGNQVRRGRALFRTVFFIPTITPIVVTSMLWVWLYEPTGGINKLLEMINIEGPNWLFNPATALPAIMIMTIWGAVGYYMIIFLAGLAEIPEVFYEAAKVDGRRPLAHLLEHYHPPAAQFAHLRLRYLDDRRLPGLHPGLHHDAGRPHELDTDGFRWSSTTTHFNALKWAMRRPSPGCCSA